MTPSEFKAQFPSGEFDSQPGELVQKYLDKAAPMFDVGRWGSHYSEGLSCYVADRIVVGQARAAKGVGLSAGNVTEKHVGPVGVSFDSALLMMQAKTSAMATDYGRRYVELRKLVGMGGVVVNR